MGKKRKDVAAGVAVPDDPPAIPAFIERAIWFLSGKHNVDDDTDFLRRKDQFCDLVSTNESHWVAAFCAYVFGKVCADHPQVAFNRFFEIPSLHSENHDRGGYDLSVGPFDTKTRYRFMHKTVLEWCDTNWVWDEEAENDKRHLAAILGEHHDPLRRHKTFFVLHVFCCIHDWRRMGMPFRDQERGNEEYCIPDFPSLLRTVVVPLDSLKKGYDHDKWVRIERKAPAYTKGSTQEYLNSIESPDIIKCEIGGKAMSPITVDELCTLMRKEWDKMGMWSGSFMK